LFAIPSIALLVVFMIVKPQEFVPMLQRVPFLHLFTVFAVLGYIVDVRLRRLQPRSANTLPWVVAFILWAIISIALNTPDQMTVRVLELAVLFAFYGVIAHGVQRFRTFQIVASVAAAACMFVAVVCLQQGFAPKQCVGGDETDGDVEGEPDGRICDSNLDCRGPDAEPSTEYRCEHVGLFGTYSVEGRVRYRGALKDPNEVALTVSAGAIALLIGFTMRRRGKPIIQFVFWTCVVLAVVTVFMTQSRGGLVSLMLVPGVYLIRRYGAAIVIPASLVAIPILMFAGRSGADAEVSTEMRYEAWAKGLDLWHHNLLFGVGPRQFGAHHFLTAHNAFVLTLAELGFVGMFLFTVIIYLCVKTLIVGLRAIEGVPGTAAPKVWGMALLAAMTGIVFQINTLSFAYHQVLWMFFGLVGAWYSAVRHHQPELEIRLKLQEVVAIAVSCLLYALVILPIFLTLKGEM